MGGLCHCPNRWWQSASTAPPTSGHIPYHPPPQRGRGDAHMADVPCLLWWPPGAGCGHLCRSHTLSRWGRRFPHTTPRPRVPLGRAAAPAPARCGGTAIERAPTGSGTRARAPTCPSLRRDKAVLRQAGRTRRVRAQSGFVPGSLSEGARWLLPGWPKKWHPTGGTPRAACPLPAPGKEHMCCYRG